MRRFLFLVLAAILAALGVWYALRLAEKRATVAVTSLLPNETLFLAHLPDLNGTRARWRQTDLYQLWREPAVQDFLRKPLTRIPQSVITTQDFEEFARLEPKDLFFAVTGWASDGPRAVGGFRFKGSAQDAEKIVAGWRANLEKKFSGAKRETVEHQQHQIQVVTALRQTLATVVAGDWLLAANNLEELKAMLDRADHRTKDRGATLADDETFSDALKHMPSSYSTLVYGRADRALEKMGPLLTAAGSSTSSPTPIYRQIHAFCGTLVFDGGKIRDVLFIGMPKLIDAPPLTRASLALGTKETFFYLASFLNIARHGQWPVSTPAATGLPALLQKIAGAVASTGITAQEWNTAFGPELGVLANWPASARMPSVLATVPVQDAAKANEALAKLTAPAEGATWTQLEKDGVRYFSMQSTAQLFAFSPTFALSDRMLVMGTDAVAVESAMRQSTSGASELATSANFQAAERTVPTAKQAFFYIDSALLYTRLDAALRPLLVMGAAFMPSLNENLDLNKWPPVAVVTKHLSPIVMSQNYKGDGYVTESVGPVTMYQAIVGLVVTGGGATMLYQNQNHSGPAGGWNAVPSQSPPTSPTPPSVILPNPSPTTTPNETP